MNSGTRIVIGIIVGIVAMAIAYNSGITETYSLGIIGAIGIWLSSFFTGKYRNDMNDDE